MGRRDDTTPNEPMLARVRALLAQAESTTYEAEAEAFTSKAQELMTRHAIDMAMVARRDRAEAPITVRVSIDNPYVDAKSLLLQHVAEHSRCRAVFHRGCATSSVIGFAADVRATDILYTSLLVQAQRFMHAAAVAPAGAHSRSRAFRTSFLVAFALRIGARLAEINEEVISSVDSEAGGAVMPALAARSSKVDEAVDAAFGPLASGSVRGGFDAAGWTSGRLAADSARLTSADPPAPDAINN
jgi:hypothetical protein